MRTLWAILLGGLALVGTAEARLGETLEEIEKRVGKLDFPFEDPPEEGWRRNLIVGQVTNKAGFELINYYFIRSDPEPRKCVRIFLLEMFGSFKDIDITPHDVHDLAMRNFSNPPLDLILNFHEQRGFGRVVIDGVVSPKQDEGFDPLIPRSPLWFVSFGNIRGDTVDGGIYMINDTTPKIEINIRSVRYNELDRKLIEQDIKMRDEKRKQERGKSRKAEWDSL